jgi:prophage regulatory protein
MSNNVTYPERLVRERERREITGVPTASWYELQAAGVAPKPVPISERARGWLLSELMAFIERRRAERDSKADTSATAA